MANLTGQEIKDRFQSLLTTSEVTSDPTTGTLQNGKGVDMTTVAVNSFTVGTDLAVDSTSLTVQRIGFRTYSGTGNQTINTVSAGAGRGGGLVIVSGVSFATGESFTRLFVMAIRSSGGVASSPFFASVASTGDTVPTFTFAESGGVITVTSTSIASGFWDVMFIKN